MLSALKQFAKPLVKRFRNEKIPVVWVCKNNASRLSKIFPDDVFKCRTSASSGKIEMRAEETNKLGAQPLWEGYTGNNVGGATRMPEGVRTEQSMGELYTFLVQELKPQTIVEFGTAFGVSGMYFLAGVKSNQSGRLFTFDPNDVWAKLAKENLQQISDQFTLTHGTFEDKVDGVLAEGQNIDLAFIDAIHTKEFVMPQLEIVLSKSSSKTIIILDDINFSDNMRECWDEVSRDERFLASATFGDRVGIVEVK